MEMDDTDLKTRDGDGDVKVLKFPRETRFEFGTMADGRQQIIVRIPRQKSRPIDIKPNVRQD